MTDSDLKYLLTLPPEEIVKWFYSKGYTFSWNWNEVWQDAHMRSFTVAKVMNLDILQSLKDEVDKIFSKGITYEQFVKNLEPELKAIGWWGKVRADQVPGYDPLSDTPPDKIIELGSPRRLSIIYQTNANVAYSAAHYKFQTQNAVSRPYWLYHQIDRKTKRKSHAHFAGKVFMSDDPIWNTIYPPNGWNCGCWVEALTKEEMQARGLKVSNGNDFIKFADKNIDPEWQYNPGQSLFSPDLSKYDSDLRAVYEAYKNV